MTKQVTTRLYTSQAHFIILYLTSVSASASVQTRKELSETILEALCKIKQQLTPVHFLNTSINEKT